MRRRSFMRLTRPTKPSRVKRVMKRLMDLKAAEYEAKLGPLHLVQAKAKAKAEARKKSRFVLKPETPQEMGIRLVRFGHAMLRDVKEHFSQGNFGSGGGFDPRLDDQVEAENERIRGEGEDKPTNLPSW